MIKQSGKMGMMRNFLPFVIAAALLVGCSSRVDTNQNAAAPVAAIPSPATPEPTVTSTPTPTIPNLQAELLDDRNKTTESPIGKVDFKNYTYPLPHGWQNPDGSEITLTNGRLDPIADEAKLERRIGMSYVTTKFLDVTGDAQDEAIVVLKIETGGSAIPQVVYVFEWKNGEPELIWPCRTGDRSDGGLKDLRAENGEFVVELYGQDRFLLGQIETGKITNDIEQLCCPTHFTRSFYKLNGKKFIMKGKRLTDLTADPHVPPVENLGDKVNAKPKAKK